MTRVMFPAISGAAIAMALAAGAAVAATDHRVIENRGQAMPKGARRAVQGKRSDKVTRARAASQELVRISNQTLVVAHLHPRWLRRLIEECMDKGATIDMADVEAMRASGSEAAARSLYWGYLGTDDIQHVDGHGPLTKAQRDALQAEFNAR